MLPRARLIANPEAGSDQAAERLAVIESRIKERYELHTTLTRGAGHAADAARAAAADQADVLFVAGGDGTLNESLNGLGQVAGAFARTAIGLIPLGTGNDFATTLGIEPDLDAALAVLLEGHRRQVDLAEVNGRIFVNVSAGGFLAEVSEAVDPALKDVAGRLAYILGGAKVLLQAEPFRCRTLDVERECLLFAVCNAPTVGGGRLIAPSAAVDDGQLDVCLIEAMDTVSFVALLSKVATGGHLDEEGVAYFKAETVCLEFSRPIAVNADGEVFQADRCDYRVLPRAATFLAPHPHAVRT